MNTFKVTKRHLEERYAEAIKNWDNCPFVEESHENADDLLCELLQQLGFNKVVDEYKKLVRFFG